MDLQSNLIESNSTSNTGGWKASLGSLGLHGLVIAFVLFMSMQATHKVHAEKPIRAFLAGSAAPPPPPPPPPPAGGHSTPKPTPTPVMKPIDVPVFHQPTEIPKELPKVATTSTAPPTDTAPPSSEPAGEPGGVPGGVAGGVAGGVEGGTVGGVVGGQLGGQLGGVVGGTPGGTVGGTGTEPAPAPAPPPPPPSNEPLRVGGDVKAPIVTRRVQPKYTESARSARVTGVVIVEAVIDKNGNVDEARILKGLPMGLGEEAVAAVKQWKFKPGTLNGAAVPVIFDLTVNFTLGGEGGGGGKAPAPAPAPEPQPPATDTTSTG